MVQPFSTCVFLGFEPNPTLNITARIRGPNVSFSALSLPVCIYVYVCMYEKHNCLFPCERNKKKVIVLFLFSKFYEVYFTLDSNFEASLTSPYDWGSFFLCFWLGFVNAGSVCKSHYEWNRINSLTKRTRVRKFSNYNSWRYHPFYSYNVFTFLFLKL